MSPHTNPAQSFPLRLPQKRPPTRTARQRSSGHTGLQVPKRALRISEKTKHEELFYTENPDTDSLRCKLLGDVRVHQGSATQTIGPNPVVKTSCTSLAFFPTIVALDTDGARRQFQMDFQPDQPPLPMAGPSSDVLTLLCHTDKATSYTSLHEHGQRSPQARSLWPGSTER